MVFELTDKSDKIKHICLVINAVTFAKTHY